MKIKYKKTFSVVVVMSAVAVFLGNTNQVSEALPESWYALPENRPNVRYLEANEKPPSAHDAAGAGNAVDRFLKANGEALDNVSGAKESNKDKWGIAAYILDMGLTHQGKMGGLLAKGDAGATVYWRPRARASEPFSELDNADLSVTAQTTPQEVSAQLDPIIKSMIATGQVKDPTALRNNLERVSHEFLELSHGLEASPGVEWYVSRLRMDFAVDVSGNISPFFEIGGGTRLRFEWLPVASSKFAATAFRPKSEKAINLKRLVDTLAQDLGSVPYEEYKATGFTLDNIRFGISAFASGKIGVVKAASTVTGHVYFSKRKAAVDARYAQTLETLDAIPLIDAEASAAHRQFAMNNGVSFATEMLETGKPGTVYDVARERFRAGMVKAAKISQFLAAHSKSGDGSAWELYKVKSEFALSLSGTTGLVTLGAKAAIELDSKRINQ